MVSVGNSCVDRGSNYTFWGTTVILMDNPAPVSGTLISWCCFMFSGGGSGKVKVFRSDGTNFIYVGQGSSESLSGGLNTFSCNIPIQAGDYIGVYITSAYSMDKDNSGGNGFYYKSGDVVTDSLISSWGSLGGYLSLGGTIQGPLNNVYVNSITGNNSNLGDSCASGHPVQTFQKAYDLLNSGGNIHVCNSGADFSGENVTFTKAFAITVDGGGNCYLPKLQ